MSNGAAKPTGVTGAAVSPAPHAHHEGCTFDLGEYRWKEMHDDLEKDHFVGTYGAHNAAFHGLAGVRAGVNMAEFHKKRSPDEFYIEELADLLKNPRTQRRWNDIITLDPMGMFATRPTQSATTANMSIPELQLGNEMVADGTIVNKEDRSIRCVKVAVDLVWNLPALAKRLRMDETVMRKALSESTQNPRLLDPSYKAYLPPVGGATVYFIGDIAKLNDPATEVAVRVHDECSGSDTFGTDICTCRPYLVYALLGCVQCAQRGGVGIIVYFRKEGRSLGEVTKFRVYNARKRQPGGDTAENYFRVTESIAGIRDARFQEMMPDILLWLGITRIDWLLSMSSDKYDAIAAAGIEVMQRCPLPDMYVPKNATVEITAKISAGYHSDPKAIGEPTVTELRNLEMIRSRCQAVYDRAVVGKTKHFNIDSSKMSDALDLVMKTTKENYPDMNIPYHSRWRHFNSADVRKLIAGWKCDSIEVARRLIDLVTISVLLDAGAGNQWKYVDQHGKTTERSEGLAIASFDMFRDGLFSSDPALPHRVNSLGLHNMQLAQLEKGFQVDDENPITGLEGRFKLLRRLSKALESQPEYFGAEAPRPGNIIDYVLKHKSDKGEVSIKVLWQAVIEGFEPIWPEHLSTIRRGDVWIYSPMKQIGVPASDMIPFHKLSQWLTYSLLEPIEKTGVKFTQLDLMTGLAEYRNGGLFVDLGVIVPKNAAILNVEHDAGSEVVVEWRSLTIICLDKLHEMMCEKLGKDKEAFPLAKMLQGGTWAAGRIIAAQKRPNRSSPIQVRSDGTVF